MQLSRKHHYLPVFYTKRWSTGDQRLCEFSKPYGGTVKPRRVHPEGTGYVRGLYNMRGLPNELKDQFEKLFLQPVDTKASDALAILESDGISHKWRSEERNAWTRFILSLMLRMPEDIENLKAISVSYLNRSDPATEARYAEVRKQNDPDTFGEWLAKNDPHVAANAGFRIALKLMDHEKIGEDISNMEWHSITTQGANHELLTSDRPLVMTTNFGINDAFLLIPIGPRRLFLATRQKSAKKLIEQSDVDALTTKVNTHVVEAANKYVYGTDDSQLRFVQNRMGTKPIERLAARLREKHS